MPNKIKVLLFAMTAGAGLIFISIFININGYSGLGANIGQIFNGQNNTLNPTGNSSFQTLDIKSDIDKDGLPDVEEILYRTDPLNSDTDADGYLDGEEINSGHDPLIPGPNDLLSVFNSNLTQKIATLAVSGLYEGSLKPENPEFNRSVNSLVSTALDDVLNDLNVEIEYEKLRFVSSNTANQEKYIKEVSLLYKLFLTSFVSEMSDLEKNLNSIGESGFNDQIIVNYYEEKALEFNEVFNKLLALDIPDNWRVNHLNLLQLIGQLTQVNAYIANGEKDPIKALVGLNRLISFLDAVPLLTGSYLNEIEKNNLKVKSTIFEK